jgi:hypothetical protein
MSIESRKRNEKRPTTTVRDTHAAQSDLHYIPQKLYGLFRPDGKKSGGGFGGCTKTERKSRKAIRKLYQTAS